MQSIKILFMTLMVLMFNSCGITTVAKKKLLVPLYSYPDTHGNWNKLIVLKKKYPSIDMVAIVNQDNGDFTEADDSYKQNIKKLSDAGIQVIGYVHTNQGDRNITKVEANIDAWVQFYKEKGLKGFFFDEVVSKHDEGSNKSKFTYYKTLSDYAKNKGCGLIVLNPGAVVNDIYMSSGIASVIVIRETTYDRVNEDTQTFNKPTATTKLGLLIYGSNEENIVTKVYDFTKKYQFDYIYATDHGKDDDRWDELSTYLDKLLAKMES